MKGCRVGAGISSTERGPFLQGLRGQRGAEQLVAGRAAWEGTAGDHGASQQVRLGRDGEGAPRPERSERTFQNIKFFFFLINWKEF